MQESLTADGIIALAHKLHVNPVTASEELGKLELHEVLYYFEHDGKLIETTDNVELALEPACRLSPISEKNEFDEFGARRRMSHPDDSIRDYGTVPDFG